MVSFPAKYMHFHCPATPIFDGMADTFIRKDCRIRKDEAINPQLFNSDYRDYVRRFYRLYAKLREDCEDVTVKMVDHFINFANESNERVQMIQSIQESLDIM